MSKLPFMKWYCGDWMKDPAVSLCSPATRGVWFDLLNAMHEAGRVGSLSGTREQLARIARCVPSDLALALTDLQTTGAADVSERNGVVTVGNRRMRRESQSRTANRLRQQRFRSCESDNGHVTPGLPSEPESEYELPDSLNCSDFKKQFGRWLDYKAERRESYKPAGFASLVSRAANLVKEHGLAAVIDAMDRAIANGWAGWDHPSAFRPKAPEAKPTPRRSQSEIDQAAAEGLAFEIIKAGRKAGKPDAQIDLVLKSRGLQWPK